MFLIYLQLLKEGCKFIFNGEKTWVTSAYEAEIGIILATIDKSMKHKGLGAFIVPLNSKGLERGKPEKKTGIRASSTCTLYLSNVEVPVENWVGFFWVTGKATNRATVTYVKQGDIKNFTNWYTGIMQIKIYQPSVQVKGEV